MIFNQIKCSMVNLINTISFFTYNFAVMQGGFAFLEAGSVRSKNTTNILIKNLLDSCEYKSFISIRENLHKLIKRSNPGHGTIMWWSNNIVNLFFLHNNDSLLSFYISFSVISGISYWIFGFAFAFGGGNAFIGNMYFAHYEMPDTLYAFWFFHFVFAATAATIVSGAVAERCDFNAYLVYSIILTGQ